MAGLGATFNSIMVDEAKGLMPEKPDVFGRSDPENPLCVFEYFNMRQKFGVELYYQEVRQFVTILRDSYEGLVSQYFFLKRNAAKFKKTSAPQVDLQTYVDNNKNSYLDYLPGIVTKDNYRDICEEFFVEIGVTEMLNQSMKRISSKLGFPYEGEIPHVNKTPRDEEVAADVRERFRENHSLEYDVYDYVLFRYV